MKTYQIGLNPGSLLVCRVLQIQQRDIPKPFVGPKKSQMDFKKRDYMLLIYICILFCAQNLALLLLIVLLFSMLSITEIRKEYSEFI